MHNARSNGEVGACSSPASTARTRRLRFVAVANASVVTVPTIGFVAEESSAPAAADAGSVAVALVRSETVRKTALVECDRAGAFSSGRESRKCSSRTRTSTPTKTSNRRLKW
jgi:hypothetical protein